LYEHNKFINRTAQIIKIIVLARSTTG